MKMVPLPGFIWGIYVSSVCTTAMMVLLFCIGSVQIFCSHKANGIHCFIWEIYVPHVCTTEVVVLPAFIWKIYVHFVRTIEMVVLPDL